MCARPTEPKKEGRAYRNVTLSGPGVDETFEFHKKLAELQKGVSYKGNIFKPVLTVDYPGFPLSFPINLFKIPQRRANYALSTLKPGYGYDPEIHDTVDDIYFIVRGKGKVDIGEVTHDAEQFDVFHIVAGTWHRLYNPAGNSEDLLVWLVETPAAPFSRKAAEWDLAEEFARRLDPSRDP